MSVSHIILGTTGLWFSLALQRIQREKRIKRWYILHVSFNSVCPFISGLRVTARHSSETTTTSSLLIAVATQIASETISIYEPHVYIRLRFSLCKTISYFNWPLSFFSSFLFIFFSTQLRYQKFCVFFLMLHDNSGKSEVLKKAANTVILAWSMEFKWPQRHLNAVAWNGC